MRLVTVLAFASLALSALAYAAPNLTWTAARVRLDEARVRQSRDGGFEARACFEVGAKADGGAWPVESPCVHCNAGTLPTLLTTCRAAFVSDNEL